MGNFSNNAITDVGRMMLADVQAGAIFTPTRIVIGSGSMTGGATAEGMTDVITPVKSLAINKKKRTPDGKCVFGGVYTNIEVTEPFYFRELALYAKAVYLNEDGSVKSEGEETLYSYGNAGATADYMPAYSTSTVVEKQMDLVTWVGNDTQVNLTIESGVYPTHDQVVLNLEFINPDTVGFDSLLEYMVSIYDQNMIVCGHISGFSDMPPGVTIMHGYINVVGGLLTVFANARTSYYYRGTNSLTRWTDDWRKVYDSSNKPSPADIGAVSTKGDTMTDDLFIEKSASPSLRLHATGNGAGGVVQQGSNQLLLASRDKHDDLSNSRILTVNNSTLNPDVAKALRLIDRVGNVESYYDILTTANMHLYGIAVIPATVEQGG